MPITKPNARLYTIFWKSVTVISNLLKSIWLFFPSILFVLLVMFIFLGLSQGKDVILTFIENAKSATTAELVWKNLLIRLSFFVAIAFWVYVSWYSSRIIAYLKKSRQLNYLQQFDNSLSDEKYAGKYEIRNSYLDHFPRLIGYACFLVLIFALLNLSHPGWFSSVSPFIILFLCLSLLWIFDHKLIAFSEKHSSLIRKLFNISGILFMVLLVLFQFPFFHSSLASIFILIVLVLAVYFFYINLRRKELQKTVIKQMIRTKEDGAITKFLKKIMYFLQVPPEEISYFKWFNIISLLGFIIYLWAISQYHFSVKIGPFPLILLAFAVLLGFGNIVTMFSVKTNVNLHFIIFIFAAILYTPENHYVRQVEIKNTPTFTSYKNRQSIDEHFILWLKNHNDIDNVDEYPVYFVLANGGASRSGYWVASVLGKLEDSSIVNTPGNRFSSHVFCLSGTSGGGVGVAAFFSLLMHSNEKPLQPLFETSAKNYLRQDFLSYSLARMFGPDYFNYLPGLNYILHKMKTGDRAIALENSFEKCYDTSYYKLRFDSTFIYQCVTQQNVYSSLPVLCINTTRVQDGNPGVVCTIRIDDAVFNKRVDVIGLLQNDYTIRLTSGAILGARFPYISPAGRIDELLPKQTSELDKKDSGAFNKPSAIVQMKDSSRANYFVDGGYFDNSGAGVVQEMISGILRTCDIVSDALLISRIKKLKLVVLHITNSPQGDVVLKKVTPFKNDMASPLLAILGAYDMQTTVNDRRLANFVTDITNNRKNISSAIYYLIHLYNDPAINADTLSNGPYAMNWFISDSVLTQMNKRLTIQPALIKLIAQQRNNLPVSK